MNNTDFSNLINDYARQVDSLINKYTIKSKAIPFVCDAMNYSLEVGGKRLRPILLLEFCKLCGGDVDLAAMPAVAVEMLHTYSLIHDDLPCMDNDDFRRGQPSCHKVYGEAFALLAGDALQNQAFVLISQSPLAKAYPQRAVELIKILSTHTGALGMIGGQAIDLSNEGKSVSVEDLFKMDLLKTGMLIKAACTMGVAVAGGNSNDIKSASLYAENLGLAFQIIDDILDVTADEAALGKPVGSDEANNKSTYVSLFGLEKSKLLAEEYTKKAISALESYNNATFLCDLAEYLLNRIN